MKILWFTISSSLFEENKHHYHGAGWISSLESIITKRTDVELGIAFYHPEKSEKVLKNKTTYYPIKFERKRINPIKGLISNRKGTVDHLGFEEKYVSVINDFKPDVIHVFGTESSFSIVGELTAIPVVLQTQGLINPIVNSYFSINQSKWSFYANPSFLINNILFSSLPFVKRKYQNIALLEARVLKSTKYIIGRTEWDKMIVKLYNPEVQYFHVDEVLRSVFYENSEVDDILNKKVFKIVSTLSPTVYKGIDVVLKTAKLLKEITSIDFVWEIIGLDNNDKILKHFEKSEKINHSEVNINLLGRLNAQELNSKLRSSNVYVHPSYIDNSPNSVCEAQIIGLPVIACNVGGVSSLIEDEVDGLLVPSNGIFEMVDCFIRIQRDNSLSKKLSVNGIKKALLRHDRTKIEASLIETYAEILVNEN
ncbi:hypothetical protein LCGC14_0119100 [marine sediment metagenome]|uniref:Glycosyl transferase family 1 domain-containing protein n=1 Tax=marine sediment metagenome TaxID=412755 RepID=A0A0F9XPI2_9ZZZZ|nr:glycosyltransferase family 4 protein [Maribacter sp.]HDZ07414.1 glycosyltransferase [Maribacter sp.]